MNKIIINVGRQIGSGGHIIAEKLAEDFGCKCYDRELLNLAAKESDSLRNSSSRTMSRRDSSSLSSIPICPS